MLTIDARPRSLVLDPAATAAIVVDMQNDFGAERGMFHRAGIPISGIQAAVAPTARTLAAARRAGIQIVYLKMEFEPDLSNAGHPDAANFLDHRRLGLGETVQAPDGREGRILIKDTWNTEILPELAPEADDIVVSKHRFSGFFETRLDAILKERGITSLVFTGCTTSICVESTLRDAFFRDYRCLLLEDCTAEPIGSDLPHSNHDASVRVIETLFGWVSDCATLEAALRQPTTAIA
ncbi:MAG: cysteine hydrolase [Actinomycetota bacterium]|nr:cysteine hydrolase [Actinomycetota bacterium]